MGLKPNKVQSHVKNFGLLSFRRMHRREAARMARFLIFQAAKAFMFRLILVMRAFLQHVGCELVKLG